MYISIPPQEPNLQWDYRTLAAKLARRSGAAPAPRAWDPAAHFDDMVCQDLALSLGQEHKFVKIRAGASALEYYLPLLLVNPLYAAKLEDSFRGGASWAFADLFNFLVRPVAEVLEAIDRFKVRYMDGNAVIGMEMSVNPGQGSWAGDGVMPVEMQAKFFEGAARLLEHDDTLGGAKGVVFLLVTDNPAQAQARLRELEAADAVSGAGVVAILAAGGDGGGRVRLELQELWTLGHADVALTTPGSRMGIVGSARTHQRPVVVLSEDQVHPSSAPYPCYARFGAIQHATCFEPTMLGTNPPDSLVPC